MTQMPSSESSGLNSNGTDMPEEALSIASLALRGEKSSREREASMKEKKLSTGSLGGSSDGVRPKMVRIGLQGA